MSGMARKLRGEYPGAIYHVINRRGRRESTFKDDQDWQWLLVTLLEACGKPSRHVHVSCLMLNHFHMVVETTPRANLFAGKKWFLSAAPTGSISVAQVVWALVRRATQALIVNGS